jgi:cell division protein FtsN
MKIFPIITLLTAIILSSCASLTRKGSSSFSDSNSPYAKEKSTTPKPKPQTNNATNTSTTTAVTTPTPKPVAEPAKAVVVREEKVKVIENNTTDKTEYNYYCIIGSFRIIENARNFCSQLIEEGFQPVILENESGLYRISVGGNNQEDMVRSRIADIRSRYTQYADVWLLKKQ